MASQTMTSPREWFSKGLALGVLWCAAGALLGLFGAYELRHGRFPELHSRYLATLLSVADSGEWPQLLVQYPFLPLVLCAGYPSMELFLAIGALATSGLAVCLALVQPNRLFAVGIAATFVSPLGIELAGHQVARALGLLLVGTSLLLLRRYLESRRLDDLFYLSVCLGVSAYTTPLALPIGIGIWTFYLIANPRSPNEALAIGLAALTPVVTVALGWAYTEWALASRIQGPVYDFKTSSQPLWASLKMAPFYVVVTGWTLFRPSKWTDLSLLVPLFAIFCTWLFGLSGSAAVGAALLVAGAAALAPLRRFSGKLVCGFALAVQIVVFWFVFWPSLPTDAEQHSADMTQAIAQEVARAKPNAVLADPQVTPRVFARAGTAKPFLTPFHDSYFPSALVPQLFVDYLLIGPALARGRSEIVQKHGRGPPSGFKVKWMWNGIRLDQRKDLNSAQTSTGFHRPAMPPDGWLNDSHQKR
jgi:hypothetical protein